MRASTSKKNGGYELEHGYTTDANGAKVFYYCLQIAHMLAQLLYKGSLLATKGRKALGSAKNLGLLDTGGLAQRAASQTGLPRLVCPVFSNQILP